MGSKENGKKDRRHNLNVKPLQLYISVSDPESSGHWPDQTIEMMREDGVIDADGHSISTQMVRGGGYHLAEVTIRKGTSPQVAAALLRKLADRMEKYGSQLLDTPIGHESEFKQVGDEVLLVDDSLRLPRDDKGHIIVPKPF